jgi:signal transduction histidine kinase
MSAMLRNSFRARLIVGAVLWISIGLLLSGLVLSRLFEELVIRQVDHDLTDHAEELRGLLERSPDGTLAVPRSLSDPRFAVPGSGLYWQVEGAKGQVLRSPSLQDVSLPFDASHLDRPQKLATSLGALRLYQQLVRTRNGEPPLRLSIAVAENTLDAELSHFDMTLAASLGVIALGLFGAAVLQVTMGLRPLVRLRRALTEVRRGHLERLPDDLPQEVAPLVQDLNSMIGGNSEMLRRARTQAGVLAHSLKTPLAVLIDEAQQLEATGQPESARVVRDQCLKMQRQIDYEMARARAAARGTLGVASDVKETLADVVSALAQLNRRRGIALQLDAPEGLVVACDPQDLSEIAGNLADNAAKWARSTVRVSAGRTGRLVTLSIEDDGPGIPEGAREAVFVLGARLDESMAGFGLGLAVTRELVTHYGGRVWLEASPLGGTRACVELPAIPL